jgi:2OG-Fe(II) oxygenase superfamily
LPLSVRDAQAVASSPATQQSPFGKGSQTLVDTSVRKSWQIDPEHFQLTNPEVDDLVGRLVEIVAKKLNVACGSENVTAELYKLLLCEEGAFFLPHQDGEKVDGMFGTLMICLPSKHTGGEIHLSHEGRHLIFSTSNMSDLEYSCAAWYSDVVHEVKPITSGYRLVLIYNLVQGSSGPITTAASRTDSKSRLKMVLSQWSAICNRDYPGIPRILAYKLSYKYSISSLSFNTLKGSDNVKFQHLDEVCKEEDFLLYLAHIKKEDSGACADNNAWRYDEDSARRDNGYETDEYQRLRNGPTADEKQDFGGCHEIIEFHRRSIQLTRVLDQNRTEVAKNIDFAIEDIAQGNIFKRAPDYENYTGYTGNEGVSTTHFYNDTIILVLPRRFRVDLLYIVSENRP